MPFTTNTGGNLIRSEVWGQELKEVLEEDLMATGYVRWLEDFPDGEVFKIPSIGQATTYDYNEDEAVQYEAMDTGQFTFEITEYLSSATYVTKKMMQDAFYVQELVSQFVPKQRRAMMEHVEQNVLALSNQQAAGDLNTINDAPHRFVSSGTSQIMDPKDFARAKYSLRKANVNLTNLVAIVDPATAYQLETLTNLVNVSNNPQWEGIISEGITTGMRFVKNVFGFDVYESTFLPEIASETVDGTSVSNGVANMFFSAAPDVLPFVGAWRQMPEVDEEYNKDRQRYEYVTTARYGTKLYRPENLVTILSNPLVE